MRMDQATPPNALTPPTPQPPPTHAQINSTERCGHCHTCLNRQLKKACLTVRAQQEAEANAGGSSVAAMKVGAGPCCGLGPYAQGCTRCLLHGTAP